MRKRLFVLFTFLILMGLPILTASAFTRADPQTELTPIAPVVVSTPNPDGSIYHIVQYGQTLEMIADAYGVSITQIRTLNGIPEGVSDIYEGQRLVIRVALPPTMTPTLTSTVPPPTRTPRNTTPIVTPTPLPTPTATPFSLIPPGMTIHRKNVGIVLLSIGALGLLTMAALHFFPIKRK